MCGRFTRYASWAQVHAFLQPLPVLPPPAELASQYNIAPTHTAWVLAANEDGAFAVRPMKWGFAPRWARDPKQAKPINARAETVATNGLFRAAFADRRCVVIANGWYEWHATADGKQPWYFTHADGEPLAFAGVYDVSRATGTSEAGFAIVTGSAGTLCRAVHDRMPLSLAHEDLARWLRPDTPLADARALLATCEPEALCRYPVDRAVNSPRNDHERLVAPIAGGPLEPGALAAPPAADRPANEK
jgi:putative SOS response-associated peptidase YedK